MNLTLGGIDLVLLFSPHSQDLRPTLGEGRTADLGKVTALCLSAAVAPRNRRAPLATH